MNTLIQKGYNNSIIKFKLWEMQSKKTLHHKKKEKYI